MIKKKICMLGSFGVGKTSLTARFVYSQYEDKYHSSVGVKIDKKPIDVNGNSVTLMIWDMAGEEEGSPVKLNYVRDAAGYVLVVDGTRRNTLDIAQSIQERVESTIGEVPFVVAVNKADERANWEIGDAQLADLTARGWALFETSAKSGSNVEDAFFTLAGLILKGQEGASDNGAGDIA